MTRRNRLGRLTWAALVAMTIVACGSGEDEASAPDADAASSAVDEVVAAADAAAESATEAAGDAADAAMEAAGDMADDAMGAAGDMADKAMAAAGDAVEAATGGDPCNPVLEVGDTIAFGINAMSVPSSCGSVTVTLKHTGQLPATAMGHNWVLVTADAVEAVANAGLTAGAGVNYVPPGDDRVVAATKIIGGGETTSVTFSLGDLKPGTEYAYVCTFPGHWTIMRGAFTVSG